VSDPLQSLAELRQAERARAEGRLAEALARQRDAEEALTRLARPARPAEGRGRASRGIDLRAEASFVERERARRRQALRVALSGLRSAEEAVRKARATLARSHGQEAVVDRARERRDRDAARIRARREADRLDELHRE
jgi:hypothetical protein